MTAPAPVEGDELLRDLLDRLNGKVSVLERLADGTNNDVERSRLHGKAQGLALAASFVYEDIRSLPASPPAVSAPVRCACYPDQRDHKDDCAAPVRYEKVEGTAWNTTSGNPVLVLSDEMTPRHEPLFRAVPATETAE